MKISYWDIRKKYEKKITPYDRTDICYYCKHFNESTNECLSNSNRTTVKPASPSCAKMISNYYEKFYTGLYYTVNEYNKNLGQEIKRLNTLKDKRNKRIKMLKAQLKGSIKS